MTEKKEPKQQEEARAITPEEARHVLEAEQARGMERCRARLAQMLREEGYVLEGVPAYVRDGDGWRTVVSLQLRPAT